MAYERYLEYRDKLHVCVVDQEQYCVVCQHQRVNSAALPVGPRYHVLPHLASSVDRGKQYLPR